MKVAELNRYGGRGQGAGDRQPKLGLSRAWYAANQRAARRRVAPFPIPL